MRREIFRMPGVDARAFLNAAPYLHLAASTPSGQPVLRALNVAPLGDDLVFHGAPAGEKLDALGAPGGRCVLSATEMVASLPSTFTDPERACPASTLYRSVQVHGVLERVDDPGTKARAMQALMERFQPEGGHVPIDAAHPRYAAMYEREVQGVLVCRVVVEHIDGKAKLAQNRTREQRATLLAALWRRGDVDDPRAVALVARYNQTPDEDLPASLRGPAGVTLSPWLEPQREAELAALHGVAEGNAVAVRDLREAHRRSAAWVGAVDEHGALVGSGRALSDGVRRAMICDVVAAPAWQGRGVREAIVELLRDHPAVRRCAAIESPAYCAW